MVAILLALLMLLSACSKATPTGPEAARALIEESAAAMGGWEALDAVKSLEILTGGGDWEPMQANEPNSEARAINTFGQSLVADFEKNRFRLTFDAIRVYPSRSPVKFAEIIDGDAGMLESLDANGKVVRERMHPSRLAARLRDLRRWPIRLLHTAKSAPELTRLEDRLDGTMRLHILHYKDGNLPVELQLDSFNKLPIRVIYTEDDPIYGDTLNELALQDWRDYQGIRLPQTQAVFLNGNKIREERVRTLIQNPKYDETGMVIPEEIRSQPENGERIVSQWPLRRVVMGVGYQDFGREQKVELVEVSKGVYHVKGSSHHSMAIEMKDHLIVVEAPLYEERSAAVMKALAEKFPAKPIKYVVVTHFHIDHSGGIRAYAAKGATIVAHESIVPFLKTVLSRPKTIRPDSLAKAGNLAPNIEDVNDTKSLTDGERTVELRQIPNPHAKAMLVAYLPAEKILFVSDLFTPGTPVDPSNTNGIANANALHTALTGAQLLVNRIVGGHGDIAPFQDLGKASALAARAGS
ncbi:MAG: hypothetical protein DMG13_22410 [Acidobacteria bacterium]|nr:MAG: hypothetical protein DMG13_22410 [Acidobacteriota bacterium]